LLPKGTGFGAVVGAATTRGRTCVRRYFEAARFQAWGMAASGGLDPGASARTGVFVSVNGVIERSGATLFTVRMIDPVAGDSSSQSTASWIADRNDA